MKVRTFDLYDNSNITMSFYTDPVDCREASGYSLGLEVSNASSGLDCTFSLESSVSKFGDASPIWTSIQDSDVQVIEDTTFNYNVSQCYYSQFRIKVTILTGNLDIKAVVLTKSY